MTQYLRKHSTRQKPMRTVHTAFASWSHYAQTFNCQLPQPQCQDEASYNALCMLQSLRQPGSLRAFSDCQGMIKGKGARSKSKKLFVWHFAILVDIRRLQHLPRQIRIRMTVLLAKSCAPNEAILEAASNTWLIEVNAGGRSTSGLFGSFSRQDT